MITTPDGKAERVIVGPHHLEGLLGVPQNPRGLVIFAHGSGSGRFSPRNNYVARRLEAAGFATLLVDLLTTGEEADRRNVFDIELLASRLMEATDWAHGSPEISGLSVGYFGASTGGGAALAAGAMAPGRVSAVVSRGGRPDLAGGALPLVQAPTLLLVGSNDEQVLELNRSAMRRMRCPVELHVVPGAGHLFEEPGTLDQVVTEATRWFTRYLNGRPKSEAHGRFADRRAAGRLLAAQLLKFKSARPLILALPRGGVPVAYEVAELLDADLDLLIVRKLGAPDHPELGIGAIIDGDKPQILLNRDVVDQLSVPSGYIHNEAHRQLREIERRREQYLSGRVPIPVTGRTVIVIDDGIATGSTVRAALRALRQKNPARLILAVPVGAPDSVESMRSECDEVFCLVAPDPFHAVGVHYDDFTQTTDGEVKQLLEDHRAEIAEAE